MKSCIPTILALSLLSACSSASDSAPAKAQHDYNHVFTAVGYAVIEEQTGDSFEMKILNAIKASKLDAYKEMAEQIHGVMITASDSVERTILKSDSVDGKVKGLVRGAQVLKSYHEGDVYITELELNMNTLPYLHASEFNEVVGDAIKVNSQSSRSVYY